MMQAFCVIATLFPLIVAEPSPILLPFGNIISTPSTSPLTVYYDSSPLVFSANISGIHAFRLPSLTAAPTLAGDHKAISTLYGKDDRIAALTIESSILSVIRVDRRDSPSSNLNLRLWGDYSCTCTVGSAYSYSFGKKRVKLVLAEQGKLREAFDFPVPVEAEACAVTAQGKVFFGGNDGVVYFFSGNSANPAPSIQRAVSVDGEVAGITVYESTKESYLFVAVQSGSIQVFNTADFAHRWTVTLAESEMELEGIAIYQNPLSGYPNGSLLVSFSEDDGPTGIGIVSLSPLPILKNTSFSPRDSIRTPLPSERCSNNGFYSSSRCICFTGYTGKECARRSCPNDCSSHGTCASANTCRCDKGWTGPDCSFMLIAADVETSANGGDGDDPAIWVHPTDRAKSRVLTTTKSSEGAGFAMFDLAGKMVANVPAGEPNNVDVIYNFKLGNRTVDLAVAACREDDTICILEVTETSLKPLVTNPTLKGFTVYGSCAYHSRKSGKHYVFVNSKTAEYLQYELTSSLEAKLVRKFTGGNGGQVEGCVVDDENGNIFIGEEPYGLWRYSAEPDGGDARVLVDSVDGRLYPDVEGVTLVYGRAKDKGLIIVSCQGVSAYNVYRRGGKHEFVGTFTIGAGKVDGVTNTDGVAAVGTDLGVDGLTAGALVVHDDVNTNPNGQREEGASFKIVGLKEVLKEFDVQNQADRDWDPRSS